MKFVIAIFLTALPFLHILRALPNFGRLRTSEVRKRFMYILVSIIALHIVIGMALQAFGIFRYESVMFVYGAVVLVSLFFVRWQDVARNIRQIAIDWVALGVVALAFCALVQVHYAYTGKYSVALTSEYKEAESMRYTYPYFSDEWYAASFARFAIHNQSLPVYNPLTPDKVPFINFECVSHSLLAQCALFFDVDPVAHFAFFVLIHGVLICLLSYLFLRECGLESFSAGFGALALLFVTNGGALPGLWTLIPLMHGFLAFLMFLFFIQKRQHSFVLLSLFLTLILYPPLAPFCVVVYGAAFLNRSNFHKKLLPLIAIIFISGIFISFFYFLSEGEGYRFAEHIKNKLFYRAFLDNATPLFYPWLILPLPILLLGVLGLVLQTKERRWFVLCVDCGVLLWCGYFFTIYRFMIDFERVVVFTALLTALSSAFSLDWFLKKVRAGSKKIYRVVCALTLLSVCVLIFFYTQLSLWEKLRLYHSGLKKEFQTAAPANHYLVWDDLRIFEGLEKNTFLAPPWKGTVLGVATHNYPLTIKPGTITIYPVLYPEFMNALGEAKVRLAEKYGIQYVYSHPFTAPGFTLIDTSEEGLSLYRFDKNNKK